MDARSSSNKVSNLIAIDMNMNKQAYMKPAIRIVRIQHRGIILDLSNNANLHNGGGSNSNAHARGFNGWDDDWDE